MYKKIVHPSIGRNIEVFRSEDTPVFNSPNGLPKGVFSDGTNGTKTRILLHINVFQFLFIIGNAERDYSEQKNRFGMKTNRNVRLHRFATTRTALAQRGLLGSNKCYCN